MINTSSLNRYGSPICGGNCRDLTQTFHKNPSHEFYYKILCSMNSSIYGNSKPGALIFSFITILISIVGLVGNGSVIWLLGFRIKRNHFTVYILNLAIADFGTSIFLSATPILWLIKSFLDLPDEDFNVPLQLLMIGYYFTYSVGLYLLTAIGVARCLSVLFPIWVRCQQPRYLSAVVSFLAWIFSALLGAMQFLVYCFLPMKTWITMARLISGVNLFVFTSVMFISTLILFIKIYCGSQQSHPGRLYTVILTTLIFFIITAVPFNLIFFIAIFVYNIHSLTIPTFVMFTSVNSSINPLIYYFVGSKWKCRSWESMKVVFQRVFKDEQDPTGGRQLNDVNTVMMTTK